MHFPYPTGHDCPLFLAPMSGVSESPFRLIARRFGADVVVSEFISAVGVARGLEHLFQDMRFEEAERPIGIQLYGADATVMARAAEMVTEACKPDFIDINFGCPVKKVVKNNGGSGCLKDLGLVQRIIRAVQSATHLPVTVKIRSGWDDTQRDPVTIADRKSTRLNSSHVEISYAVFCLKKKKKVHTAYRLSMLLHPALLGFTLWFHRRTAVEPERRALIESSLVTPHGTAVHADA